MFDVDGDGTIDIPEFINTVKSLGQNPSQSEIDDMMKVIDANGETCFQIYCLGLISEGRWPRFPFPWSCCHVSWFWEVPMQCKPHSAE